MGFGSPSHPLYSLEKGGLLRSCTARPVLAVKHHYPQYRPEKARTFLGFYETLTFSTLLLSLRNPFRRYVRAFITMNQTKFPGFRNTREKLDKLSILSTVLGVFIARYVPFTGFGSLGDLYDHPHFRLQQFP